MKRFNLHLCLFVMILACVSQADTTHVGGRIEGGVWDIEGSPYIVEEHVWIDDNCELIIEPGVTILFTEFTGLGGCTNSNLVAEGTEEDSIWFLPAGDDYSWSGIQLSGPESISSFSYCYFNDIFYWIEGWGAIQSSPRSFEIRHSTFNYFDTGIVNNCPDAIIEDCLFMNSLFGTIISLVGEGNIRVTRCVFINTGAGRGCINLYEGTVDGCLFFQRGYCVINRSNRGIIRNNIFYESRYPISGNPSSVINNTFFSYLSIFNGNALVGVGVLDRVNANGDSTDCYGNLFMDPLLVGEGGYPEEYYLTVDSPCIDAGDPESDPDPDGTPADIGAFYFHQRDIEIEPETISFETPGTPDSAAVTIRNIGLTALTITSQSITPDDTPFSIANENNEFEIDPQGEHITLVRFEPDMAGEYEAVLTIESDDPDEELVEILLSAVSSGIEDDESLQPLDFGIIGAYPNPFNSSTGILYSLPNAGEVKLTIYDISGRERLSLFNGHLRAGVHSQLFDGTEMPTGTYLVELRVDGYRSVDKVVLIK